MIDLLLALSILAVTLALDLTCGITRAVFTQTSHARLLATRVERPERVAQAGQLLSALPRLRASLNLTLVTTRFLLAGIVLWLVQLRPAAYPWLVAGGALFLAAVLLFWLEWTIERIALHNPEDWALRLTPFVRLVMIVAAILLVPVAPGHTLANPSDTSGGVTEDELKTLVDAGQEEGVFASGERRMIYSIFDLGNKVAREIMVPRIEMLALDVETSLPDAIDALLSAGHSRVPVYGDTVDNTLGLLYAKDLLRAWRESGQIHSLRRLLRPAYFVPEAKKIDELLAEMQTRRIHMAIVVDEYGGVAGLVTLEDIVEEILGEIQDEYDQGEEAPFQRLPDGSMAFVGRIGIADFNELMGADLPSDEADTLGGYIYGRLGRVPMVGDQAAKENLLLTVEQVSGRGIRKVGARWLPQINGQEERENVDG